ncbi:MAG: DUF2007 domain-containing protein [Bacteroidales bacterium]|nr:DUF2007 domain-containing protein [Bacteroidales bacterium]
MNKHSDQWALLFECTDEIKLEKVKSELQQSNIPFTVINKKDSTFLIGEYEVYVPVESIGEAKQLLKGIDVELE